MLKLKKIQKTKFQKTKKPNDKIIECEGVIVEVLPNAKFKVKLNDFDFIAIVKPSGRMQTHKIKIIKGDHVKVELSTYNLTEGRIIFRNRISNTHLIKNINYDENKK